MSAADDRRAREIEAMKSPEDWIKHQTLRALEQLTIAVNGLSREVADNSRATRSLTDRLDRADVIDRVTNATLADHGKRLVDVEERAHIHASNGNGSHGYHDPESEH